MVLEKNIKRYLDLITQVYYQKNHSMYKNTLRDSLGISVKTMDSDIEKINHIFYDDFISQKNNQIVLNLDVNQGLKQIYKSIIKTSTVVSYFFEVSMYHLTLSEIYNDLYLSESMEYRLRKAWNNHFVNKNYNVAFVFNNETKKIDLIGDENTIRSLMRYMLYELLIEDLYDNLQYQEINEIVELISNKKKLNINYVAKDLVSGALFISLIRISQGYETDFKADSTLKSLFKYISKEPQIVKKINDIFNVKFSLKVLSDVFCGRLSDLIKLLGYNNKRIGFDNSRKLVSFVSAYSRSIYNKDIYLKKNEVNLLKGICNFSDFQVSSFIYSPHELYWRWVASEKAKDAFNSLIISYRMTVDLPTTEKKIEFFFALNNMLNFGNLEESISNTKILIVSRYPPYYQKRIETAINERYHEFVDLMIYEDSLSKLDEQIISSYDFIISEFRLPSFSDKHIYFPEILSDEFIYNLDDIVFHF
ncbi:hypothetical protein IGI86_002651 [Enterococcus sp. AZ188]|uniref:hypothetical protein n=1 Tax=Enterococcus sp. AZ188 TaxID=2774678 RepID=UPI003D2FD5D2